jgi:hypothetical protein
MMENLASGAFKVERPQRAIQQDDDLRLPSSPPPRRPARRSVPLSPTPMTVPLIESQAAAAPGSTLSPLSSPCRSPQPRRRPTTSFFLYPSPPDSPAPSTRRLVSPPPPATTASSPSPSSSSRLLSPNLSPFASPKDRRRSNSTHVMWGQEGRICGSLPPPVSLLTPPQLPPRRRRSSPNVGKLELDEFLSSFCEIRVRTDSIKK